MNIRDQIYELEQKVNELEEQKTIYLNRVSRCYDEIYDLNCKIRELKKRVAHIMTQQEKEDFEWGGEGD